MTEDMLIRFFENYGWIMTVLATSGIVLVGFLKACGAFKKVNATYKKYVYFGVSCVISILACTIYLCASHKFEWASWGVTAACIIGFTLTLYGVYENTGLRDLLKKVIFTPLKNAFKKMESNIVTASISNEKLGEMALNLGADALTALAEEAKKRQEEAEAAAKAKAEAEAAKAEADAALPPTENSIEKIEGNETPPKDDNTFYGA